MNPSDVGDYRDRSSGLTVCGVLEILLGAALWLLVPLALFALAAPPPASGAPPSPALLLPAVGFYGVAGTGLIWLGIGSILARRWARALWVCLSGIGLAMGILGSPFMVYLALVQIPRSLAGIDPGTPPAAIYLAEALMLGTMLLFYLVIPGVLFWFYSGRNVKRTCEVRDPRERWTDRCPLPVLALVLLTAFGGAAMAILAPFFPAFPVFGHFATGNGARVLLVTYAVVMLAIAWGLYRLRDAAWWAWLLLIVLMALSGVVTLSQADLGMLYLQMGFDERVAEQAVAMAGTMRWLGALSLVPWLGWGLYVRRFFPRQGIRPAG